MFRETDTTLDSDLVNCPNNGIVIGADNITLNLNDHTIDGDRARTEGCFFPPIPPKICDTGVLNVGHSGVTVMNGSIHEFRTGLLFTTEPSTARILDSQVLGLAATGNGFGIEIVRSSGTLVQDSSGSDSHFDRMSLQDSDHATIVGSSFRDNERFGLDVSGGADDLIKGNASARNSFNGISVRALSHRIQVRRNDSVRDGTAGIVLYYAYRSLVVRNRVADARRFRGEGGQGIAIQRGNDNVVAHNVVVDPRGAGVGVGLNRPLFAGDHNVVRANLVNGSGGDDFLVHEKVRHSVLKRNVATEAADDGFDVESRAKLTRNQALRNSDLGIEAVHGVIDGGGNIARHNGDRRQCTNIRCSGTRLSYRQPARLTYGRTAESPERYPYPRERLGRG
jgi:large repetitive protein